MAKLEFMYYVLIGALLVHIIVPALLAIVLSLTIGLP